MSDPIVWVKEERQLIGGTTVSITMTGKAQTFGDADLSDECKTLLGKIGELFDGIDGRTTTAVEPPPVPQKETKKTSTAKKTSAAKKASTTKKTSAAKKAAEPQDAASKEDAELALESEETLRKRIINASFASEEAQQEREEAKKLKGAAFNDAKKQLQTKYIVPFLSETFAHTPKTFKAADKSELIAMLKSITRGDA